MISSRRTFVAGMSAIGLAAAKNNLKIDRSEPEPTSIPDLHPLQPVPIHRVQISDEFWSPKFKVWQEVTIRDCFHKFENDRGGAINNFDKVRDGQKAATPALPGMTGLSTK